MTTKPKRPWLKPALIAVLALSLGFGYLILMNSLADGIIAADTARAKSLGVWNDSADEFLPVVNASNSAAPLYMVVKRQLRPRPVPNKFVSKAEFLSRYAEWAKSMAPVLEVVRRAASLPYLRFYHAKDSGSQTDPTADDLAPLVEIGQDLVFRAQIESELNQPKEAAQDLITAMKVARHEGQTDNLTGYTIREATERQVTELLPSILTNCPKCAAYSRGLIDLLAGPRPLLLSLRGQVILDRAALSHPLAAHQSTNELEPAVDRTDELASKIPVFRKSWLAGLIEAYTALMERIPINPTAGQISAVDEFLKQNMTRTSNSSARAKVRDNDSAYRAARLKTIHEALRQYEPTTLARRLAAQALAILALPHPPLKLPLVGEFAIDPTTGQPLHYAITNQGFLISGSNPEISIRYPNPSTP